MTRIFADNAHEPVSANEKTVLAVFGAMALIWLAVPAIQRCYLTGLFGMSDGFVAFPELIQPLHHPFLTSLVLAVVLRLAAERFTRAGLVLTLLLAAAGVGCLCLGAKSAASKKNEFQVTEFPDMHTNVAILFDTGSTVYARELDAQGGFKSKEGSLVIPNPRRDLGSVRTLRTIAR